MRFFSAMAPWFIVAQSGMGLLFLFPVVDLTIAGALAEEPLPTVPLFSTRWSASAYSYQAAGTACWIQDDEGSLRVELRNDSAAADDSLLEPLLSRQGEGWTLILGERDQGTLNAWGREWQAVPRGLAQMVRLVTESVRVYPGERPDFSFASTLAAEGRTGGIPRPAVLPARASLKSGPDLWRYQLAPIELEASENEPDPDFRMRMTARGRGTGGKSEIIAMKWLKSKDGGAAGLEVASSRRPGTLRLEPVGAQSVPFPEPEVFLPLWPLTQFYEIR